MNASVDQPVDHPVDQPVDQIAQFEQLLREKDDMLQAQFMELTECRRQLALAQEGVTHWRRMAAQHEAAANEFHTKWLNGAPVFEQARQP